MKTMSDIIDFAQDGNMPTHEECYWAMLALNALGTFHTRSIMRLAEAEREGKKPILTNSAVHQAEQHFLRLKTAYQTAPKDWLGPEHDPSTPECQKWRKMSKGILQHVIQQPANPS